MLYSITVCPTLNLLLRALNPVSAEAHGEQQVIYMQAIHAADIRCIEESKKASSKMPGYTSEG